MSLHVIVGAGPIGTATAIQLAKAGHRVRVITRRGGGAEHPAVEQVAADATDGARLSALAEGAAALYNCASPPYHRWLTDWPPLASALLTAAERSGATLVTMSNLYGYGEVSGPIVAQTPLSASQPKLRLRADMWRSALAAHQAGRLRATEVRASDYLEANSVFSQTVARPVRAGKRAYVPAPLDVPHSWTSIHDAARTLVAVAHDERALGRAWHVPTNPPLTIRELATLLAEVTGAPAPKLTKLPYPVLWTAGLVNPMARELRITRYQSTRPFVLDASETTETFGLAPTPLAEALRDSGAGP